MKKILITGNLTFIPISSINNFINGACTKYITGSTTAIFTDEIYTEEEIRAKYPDVEEALIVPERKYEALKDTVRSM